ncbi:unnamed protein product [Schistosoma margrebowiei]|uniref:Uncharacterized protein n=1 Tax=Schistosoma margrebowiei TaxID=48269 RepID=A0A183NCC0_9TREM|nr:unnamed protein product [Schistosoma margrebowiei]
METSTSEGKHEIQWISRMQLNAAAAAPAAVGLNIHKGKSRILRYNTACTNPTTIDGEDLEDVKPLHTWATSLMNMVDLMQM